MQPSIFCSGVFYGLCGCITKRRKENDLTLDRNQVYVEEEDFAFVADFIRARCRNAKVKGEKKMYHGKNQ